MFEGKKVKNVHTGKYRKNKIGGWILDSKAADNCSLENKINYLMKKLLPKNERLRKLNSKYTKTLSITVEPNYDIAVKCILLPLKLIKILSALGIEVTLDIHMPHQMKKYHPIIRNGSRRKRQHRN